MKSIIGKRSKKAQHEIVGFIVIVVIVSVIGLFLLVFYLRQSPIEKKSMDIQNFLKASMDYTTDCALNYEPEYETMQDLIKSSYRNENQECLDGRKVIDVLNITFSELIKESLKVGPDRSIKAYSLFVYYEYESGTEEPASKNEILKSDEGTCSGDKTGAEHLIAYYPGNIFVSIEICS